MGHECAADAAALGALRLVSSQKIKNAGHTLLLTRLTLSEIATTSSKSNIVCVTFVVNALKHNSAFSGFTVLERCVWRLGSTWPLHRRFLLVKEGRFETCLLGMATASTFSSARSSLSPHSTAKSTTIWNPLLGLCCHFHGKCIEGGSY